MKQALKFGFRTEGAWLVWTLVMASAAAALAWFAQLSTPYVILLMLTVMIHLFIGLFRVATAARFLAARRLEGDTRLDDELHLAWERRSWNSFEDAHGSYGSDSSDMGRPPGWSFNTNGMPMQGGNSLQDVTGQTFGSSDSSSSSASPF